MLILTRRENESLVIGEGADTIEIVVLRLRGNQVQIGIKAPPKVRVLRGELVARDKDWQWTPPTKDAMDQGERS